MKKRFYILCITLFLVNISRGQIFHFPDSSTTLIKTTAQSPAHWYLEIYNDTTVDYTLRWKTTFFNIPVEWDINFDTQTAFYFPVMDGDSADFILLDTVMSPQKLIIGAATNNMAGHGSVFFDIYDPMNPINKVTIEYEFIITGVPAGLDDPISLGGAVIHSDYIEFPNVLSTHYSILNTGGQIIALGNTEDGICSISGFRTGMYFVYLEGKEKNTVIKFVK